MPTSAKSNRPLSIRTTRTVTDDSKMAGPIVETTEEVVDSPNPKYIEPVRFSARRNVEGEGSSVGRIILYVVVVVVVGVGLTLLIQNFVTGQGSTSTTTSSAVTSTEEVVSSVNISTLMKADSTATSLTPNTAYTTGDSSLGSAANDVSDAILDQFSYQAYETFSRTTWEFDGLESGKLPATTVVYSPIDSTVTVSFAGVDVSDAEMLQEFTVRTGNVVKIVGSKTDTAVSFVLSMSESGKYYVFVDNGTNVSLDIKTDTQLATVTSASSSSEAVTSSAVAATSSSSASAMTGAPAAPHYDNTASQNKQYVVSNVTGNGLYSETYYYIDYGDSFQFSWAMRNEGETQIPNATAELVTDSGKDYIEVKINNLGYELLHALGRSQANITIPTSSSKLVAVHTRGYSNGTATFWVELTEKTEFRLHSTQTYEGHQLLGIQVMD